ncbi:partner of xrn-2 protein 1-like [Phlebotomus argentipes]|uniref:partner of xrn-2 protein 1-like n=1 Tax=Phlebotomus argentipes TaxID=94469 RepID=UPI00289312A1|nr:partner of xrn-2 protein 1-like [Phlebotomus argentipes]
MDFPTNWKVEDYRTTYESDEHWQLRRNFMETHKEKFPEDELVCLAQTFTNVEFLGCRYPAETMRLVAELSKDVAKEFRKKRESRLKRTFVQASDAAEAKAKRVRK